jgi:hypothetical protein
MPNFEKTIISPNVTTAKLIFPYSASLKTLVQIGNVMKLANVTITPLEKYIETCFNNFFKMFSDIMDTAKFQLGCFQGV